MEAEITSSKSMTREERWREEEREKGRKESWRGCELRTAMHLNDNDYCLMQFAVEHAAE